MIFPCTKLTIMDNSGAKLVKCRNVLSGSKSKHAKVGKIIRVSLHKARWTVQTLKKELMIKKKPLEKKLYSALIVGTTRGVCRSEGVLKFDKNYAILLALTTNKKIKYKFLGSRIRGCSMRETRWSNSHTKHIISLIPLFI